jgi:hypothetical protein
MGSAGMSCLVSGSGVVGTGVDEPLVRGSGSHDFMELDRDISLRLTKGKRSYELLVDKVGDLGERGLSFVGWGSSCGTGTNEKVLLSLCTSRRFLGTGFCLEIGVPVADSPC